MNETVTRLGSEQTAMLSQLDQEPVSERVMLMDAFAYLVVEGGGLCDERMFHAAFYGFVLLNTANQTGQKFRHEIMQTPCNGFVGRISLTSYGYLGSERGVSQIYREQSKADVEVDVISGLVIAG